MENKTKDSNVCMACTCPCEKHKEHAHGVGSENAGKDKGKNAAKVCGACGSKGNSCACN